MITIRVTPAKERFGRKPRKQWNFELITANNEPIDPRDTYANVNDIREIWHQIVTSDEPVQLEIHYASGIRTERLR